MPISFKPGLAESRLYTKHLNSTEWQTCSINYPEPTMRYPKSTANETKAHAFICLRSPFWRLSLSCLEI